MFRIIPHTFYLDFNSEDCQRHFISFLKLFGENSFMSSSKISLQISTEIKPLQDLLKKRGISFNIVYRAPKDSNEDRPKDKTEKALYQGLIL